MEFSRETATRFEVIGSVKTKQVAERRADEYAGLNSFEGTVAPKRGEVFATTTWNGQGYLPIWLRYDVVPVGTGKDRTFEVTVTRWAREEA